MKKAISILMVLCMVIGFVPAYAAETDTPVATSGVCGDNLTWEFDESTGTLTISGTGEMWDFAPYQDNPAPWMIKGQWSWENNSIKSVILSEGVTSIGAYAFEGSQGVENVKFPSTLQSIGTMAFFNNYFLQELHFPAGLESIGDAAFHASFEIKEIILPYGLKHVGAEAFSGGAKIEKTIIPETVTDIGYHAFTGETAGPLGSGCDIEFGWTKAIPDNAFGGNLGEARPELVSVTIPEGIEVIGDAAFQGCPDLKHIELPDSLREIGNSAFNSCESLENIFLPESLQVIGASAFFYSGLKSIVIPQSVQIIGQGAFSYCGNLETVSLSNKISEISISMFAGCGNLMAIRIPADVSYIGASAFQACRNLSTVLMPAGVNSINNNAFDGCNILETVYYSGSQVDWNAIDFGTGNEDLTNANIIFAEPTPENYKTGNGTNPEISELYIVDVSEGDVIIGISNNIQAVFNKNITVADTSKSISIWELETGRMFTLFFVNNPNVNITKNVLSIDLSDFDLYSGRTYYVRIQSGAIKSTDGDIFFGLTDNTTWRFTMPRDLRVSGITYSWDKKWYGKEDKSKPPVPNGTDDQYAQLLRNWAWSMGWELEINDALKLLDYPAYLPVTDVNNQPVLLNDNATTVRQVIEDIVFVSELQSYIDDLDNELEDITPSTEAESAWGIIAEILGQEAEAYETAAGWYEQVDRYLSGRAEDSNFFLSLGAPIAYQVLTQTIGEAKVGTIGKAYLDTIVNETALQTVDGAEKYDEFKSTVQDIGNIGKGTAAAYTALMNGEANKVIKFSTNLLADYLAKSDNEMLSDIATAYKDLNKVIPAVKLCMFLGSTAGMFPMVIDLYNDLNRSRYDQVKAAYFIANYYIIEKEPELYDTIMSLDDGRIHSRSYVWEKFTDDAFDYQSALEAAEQSGDPIIENWARFINSGRMADVDEVDSSLLWRNIASYATILRFAKSINVNDTIVALIDHLQSEGQAPATTGISVSCPVRVNIYDMDDNLVASLSSEDSEIADCAYGTMYLLGENGETKYFLLNSEDYKIEIVPYADGTMDVSITNSNEDGTAEGVYYEDVELRTGMTITTDSLVEDGASLEVNEGEISSSITPEDEIPVTGISVDTLSQLAVGESVTLRATIAPETATDKTLTWTSSNPGIIEVSSDGIITAMSAGNATITATGANGVSASVDISAYTPAQSVSLDVQSLTMCVGEEYSLTASVEPSNTTHPIKWYSSAGSVAVVDENGCITALSEGMAVLTANIDGVSASVTVTVSESPVEIILYQSDTNGDRIKVDMLNNSLYSNYTGSVFISLYDANGRMLSTSELPLALSAGTHMTGYIPITNWDGHSELTAKAFTIDGQMLPVSSSTEINIIG